jgi:glycosyltransferase involved in cell wall biosynthesis
MKEVSIHEEAVFFSIIIPVYNVEDYLNQCLDSILCQTYSKYEIVLVNDGSTDSSFQICQKYHKDFSQIKLINKENGGLSDARNRGLNESEGDYIIFTDSDDYWIGNYVLNDLNNLIKEFDPDLIIHEESRFFAEKDVICKHNQRFIKEKKGKFDDYVIDLVYYDLFVASAWDKVIRRSILIDNKLFFPLGRKSEDIEWCARLMHYIDTFSIYSKSFYIYRQVRKGSITTNVTEKHIEDVYFMVKNGLNAPKSDSESINQAIENYWAFNYVVILKDFYVLSSKIRSNIWNDILSWKYLLQRKRNIRVDKVVKFYQFLPFKALILFLNGYRIKTILFKKYRALK